jgi:mannitol-1-phosphate/altronate dehydrogenase
MKIAILVEGATEVAFKEKLREFLQTRLEQNMPRLKIFPQDGRIPKGDKLKRVVENLLTGKNAYDALKDFVNRIISLCDKSQVIP